MSGTQTQTQVQTQAQTESINIKVWTEPGVEYWGAGSGFTKIYAYVTVRGEVEVNGNKVSFDDIVVSSHFDLETQDDQIANFVKLVHDAKNKMLERINKFIALREKVLSALSQFGTVEEHF